MLDAPEVRKPHDNFDPLPDLVEGVPTSVIKALAEARALVASLEELVWFSTLLDTEANQSDQPSVKRIFRASRFFSDPDIFLRDYYTNRAHFVTKTIGQTGALGYLEAE